MSQKLSNEEILRFDEIIDNLKEMILFYMEDNILMAESICNKIIEELETIIKYKKNNIF